MGLLMNITLWIRVPISFLAIAVWVFCGGGSNNTMEEIPEESFVDGVIEEEYEEEYEEEGFDDVIEEPYLEDAGYELEPAPEEPLSPNPPTSELGEPGVDLAVSDTDELSEPPAYNGENNSCGGGAPLEWGLSPDYFPLAPQVRWEFDNGQTLALGQTEDLQVRVECSGSTFEFFRVDIAGLPSSGPAIRLPYRPRRHIMGSIWVAQKSDRMYQASGIAVNDTQLLCSLAGSGRTAKKSSPESTSSRCCRIIPLNYAPFMSHGCTSEVSSPPDPVQVPAGTFRNTLEVIGFVDGKQARWVFAKNFGLIQFSHGDEATKLVRAYRTGKKD